MRKIAQLTALFLLAQLTALSLFAPTLLWAQDGTIPIPGIAWRPIVAMLINTIGVTLLVQLAKRYMPGLSTILKQILTAFAGPALLFAGNALSNFFGYPIDFSSLIEIISIGLMSSVAATVPFRIGKAEGRGRG